MIDGANGIIQGLRQPVALTGASLVQPAAQTQQFVNHATQGAYDDWQKAAAASDNARRYGASPTEMARLGKEADLKAAVYHYWLQQKLTLEGTAGGTAAFSNASTAPAPGNYQRTLGGVP